MSQDIEEILKYDTGHPSIDGQVLRDWYSGLTLEDAVRVRTTLVDWLRSSSDDRVLNALWFVTWVSPHAVPEQELVDLAKRLSGYPLRDHLEVITACCIALATVEARWSVNTLKQWAAFVESSESHVAATAAHISALLLELSTEEGLCFAPGVLEADLACSEGGKTDLRHTAHYMATYMRLGSSDAERLGAAYSGVSGERKRIVLSTFREVVHERDRRRRLDSGAGSPRQRWIDSTIMTFIKDLNSARNE